MSLFFDDVLLLTYQHTPTFFEAGLRYKIVKNFTISGTLTAYENADGVKEIWDKEKTLQLSAQDYQPIILNGVNFGMGKILNIALEIGADVREKDYTYQIQCYQEGNLFNAQENYDGLTWTNIEAVERMDETFTFNSNERGDISYDHNVTIRFNKLISNLATSPIDLAKALAENFMEATNLVGFIGNYEHDEDDRKLYTEVYNLIDNSCSFTERYETPATRIGDTSVELSYTIELNEKGIVRVTENGIINGISTPPMVVAQNYYNANASDAQCYTRAEAVCNSYSLLALPLSSICIEKGVVFNKFEGTINYHKTFTNDPRINSLATWDYTITADKSIDNVINVSENGTIKGMGRPRAERYSNAVTFYNSIKSGILARLTSLYLAVDGPYVGNLVLTKTIFGRDEFIGEVTYGETWSDASAYLTINPEIRKQIVEITTEYPVERHFLANVINYKQILQRQNSVSLGAKILDIKLKGSRTTSLDTYVAFAKDIAAANFSDGYIKDCRYSFSPASNDFSFNLEYVFNGSAVT